MSLPLPLVAEVARLRRLVACLGVLFFTLLTSTAFAAGDNLGDADAAWHRGDLEGAQKLYEKALDKGGLSPKEVVLAYSRVGTVKAALRDERGALSDFRVAAVIDPEFELPADSGPKAKELYGRAQEEAKAQGESLTINVKAPKSVKANNSFKVSASIPEGFSVFVTEIVFLLEDTLTGKKWRKKKESGDVVTFTFPGKVAEAGARLKLTVSGVDGRNNAWVQKIQKIKVTGERKSASAAAWTSTDAEDPFADDKKKKKAKDKDGGFFDGPVPWIVGGAILLTGAVVGVVFITGGSDDASVGAPAWQ